MGQKKGLTIGKVRSSLYASAKVLGDVNAVVRGTILQRLTNRYLGNLTTQLIRWIVNAFFGGRK
jgi:hypothetical protein